MKVTMSEFGMAIFYAVFGCGYIGLMSWFLTSIIGG